MPKETKITVGLDLTITKETADRCMRILAMYFEDNPNNIFELENENGTKIIAKMIRRDD